ncbi:MAG: WD40 repeat domain-containing protein [Gemmataceae bacterium]
MKQLQKNLLGRELKEELTKLQGPRGFEVNLLGESGSRGPSQELSGHSPKEAWSAAFHPNGTLLATGGDDHLVRLWDPNSGAERGALTGPEATVSKLAFSPDGKILAGAGFDYHVTIWDMNKRQVLARLPQPDRVRSVAFSHDGRLLAAAGGQHPENTPSIDFRYIWEVDQRKLLLKRQSTTSIASPYCGLAFSKGKRELISVCADKAIHFWDLQDQSERLVMTDSALCCMAISPTQDMLATGDREGRIRLWDLTTGEHRLTGNILGPSVWGLAFTPDGKTLASASEDNLVRLWDVETMEPFYALDGHEKRVNSVAFSPDGSMLASVSHDGEVHIWRTGVPLINPPSTISKKVGLNNK